MYETKTIKEKLKLFAVILIPILITQLSMYAMNFFDTVMSGNAGTEQLAGVAIGSSLWVPIFTGINGVLLALSPIVAQMVGAKKEKEIPETVRQGLLLSIAIAVVVAIVGFFLLDPILIRMDLEQEVRHVAKYYLIALGVGIVPLFVFNLLRSFMDALGQTRISMFIILIALPLNILFNYIFIFGKFGLPALGGIGAGLASALTYWISSGIAIWIVVKIRPFSIYSIFKDWKRPSLSYWWEQLRIGVPMGFAIFFETSIFAAVTLMMSVYDTNTIAAHQAAINFASFLYMIPLSIAMALTIVVGFEVGSKRYRHAQIYTYMGITMGVVIAFLCGFILYTFDETVARLYTNNPEVVKLTTQFIFYAIFFQFADAIGAPLQGALRGYKDVNITLIMALVSYWIIGLPSGWIFANYTDFGPFGYWMGIIFGLSAGAITLFFRLLALQKYYLRL
ncbi:MATE family efflux transporter [Aquibacillus sp. 3ASR75-11]|uniref:Probable multidrug resistance protein NorM n=1 Tax=Terrihalobacillus insolitus TaxID=2950438 RepID=A0A9X4ANK6_9BACI|nr:MATE family efflux transporter [Terrihalobacillus insolitus]MDC3413613.1 MATE family efflux transporter [Terrihalobacillus insolitus]MDC3424630.1 MATE family efflux transporter [Terrihalobacillus insolitus]